MADAYDIALVIGRLLFGGFFVINAFNHFANREMMTDYTRNMGVPAPGLAVVGTGLLLLVGGLSVLLGVYPLVGLAAIALFLVGVTPKMHPFWAVDDPQQAMAEQTQFMKNVALLGAALALAALQRPWAFSIS